MKNGTILLLLMTFVYTACRESKDVIDHVEIATQYYKALDQSDHTVMARLLTDSLFTKEVDYDYEQTFSIEEYVEWTKWDSVFEPTYTILEIDREEETVKAKISKIDDRIAFLHNEPIVTTEVLHFEKNKIRSIERSYVQFNDSVFVSNRTTFLSWIDQNHPELTGFIYDQTKEGGMTYLKAIDFYKNKE